MAKVRTSVLFLIFLVNARLVASQPTFGTALWCNMFCADEDESEDDSYDYGLGLFDLFDMCAGCSSSSEPEATTEKPAQQPVKLMIPPSTGLNLTVFSNLGGVLMDLVPWIASPTTPAAAPAAAATTAAPAATTPANGTETTTKKA